jgi:hypothetical protein
VKPALALAPLLVALAFGAAGCGRRSKPSSTVDWANGVCTAITTWTGSLSATASTLEQSSLDRHSLESAAGDVRDATRTLADDLRALGKPDTQAGQAAQQSLDDLSAQADANVETIRNAVDGASGVGGALGAVSTVGSTLATMGRQVRAAYAQLSRLDPGGELRSAFRQADACAALRSR